MAPTTNKLPLSWSVMQNLLDQDRQVEAEDAIREAVRIYRLHKQTGPPFIEAMGWYCHLLCYLGKISEAEAVGESI